MIVLQIIAWMIALLWWSRVLPAMLNLHRVPNLLGKEGTSTASVTVIVPAKNEAAAIEAALRSLMLQDHPNLHVIAVDDRSEDETGILMDRIAVENPSRMRVLHIQALPEGWTGKVHAMSVAAQQTESDWLLFTDGDVRFRSDAIRLALAQAERDRADHFVLIPTMDICSFGEGMVLGFFQTFSVWVSRPWKVPDAHAKRDVVGIGAFNLIRRSAYEGIGGFEARPMEILEDMQLARAVKLAGLRSQVAFGRGMLQIHWASGVRGLVGVMTKNTFAGFGFRVWFLLAAALGMLVLSFAPEIALFFPPLRLSAIVALSAIAGTYVLYARRSGISAGYFITVPFAALIFVYTMVLSMLVAVRDGGVTWRGTFYPLAELRRRATAMW